jgi:response regulator RpfG family c-di-GMP phosphodiesterase
MPWTKVVFRAPRGKGDVLIRREAADAKATKHRLLAVDDHPGNLFAFNRVLRSQYDITLASSGAEALEKLEDEQQFPDVVLVDFAMPIMNGAELLARIRTKHLHLPCLFLTAHAELDEVRTATRQFAVVGVILKPWEREDVERRVEHAIRIGNMRRSAATIRI